MGTLGYTESHSSHNEGSVHRRHPCLASAGFAPTCDECNAAAAGLLERLTSEESIAEQMGILISQVCPQAADAAACEAGLTMWWSDMANCLYPAFIGGGDPCGQLGLCKVKSAVGDWTCDDCTDIMTRVAEFMKKDETIAQGISILQGECFCGAEGHTADCPALVEGLAAPVMQVLSAVLMETTPELCQDIVGVC